MKKLLILLLILSSCSPEETVFNVEAIIINKTNEAKYFYSDFRYPHMGWVEKNNGDKIEYYFGNDTIYITSERDVKVVYYIDGNNYISSPYVIGEKRFFQKVDTTKKNVFRLYY